MIIGNETLSAAQAFRMSRKSVHRIDQKRSPFSYKTYLKTESSSSSDETKDKKKKDSRTT
jgi:hypothetical protein